MPKLISKRKLKQRVAVLETTTLNLLAELAVAKIRLDFYEKTPAFDDPLRQIRIESKGLNPQIIHDYIVEHWDDMLPRYEVKNED